MDTRVPKIAGTVKVLHHDRIYVGKNRPISEIYISTDWSKDGMGAVFLQADKSVEAIKTEAQ